MTLSGKVSLKVKMTILIIEILIIGSYGVVVGDKNMGAIRNDAIASMEEYVSEEHPEYSQEEIQQELQPILQKMQQEKKAKQDQFFYFMVIMCILTDIWVLYLTFDITSGVKRSALFAKKMGQGDFTQRVEEKYLKREDEIGILARSIRDIHHNMRHLIGYVQREADTLDETVGTAETALAKLADEIDSVSGITQELAAGNQETAAAAQEVNTMSGEIEEAAKGIAEHAQEGNGKVDEIHTRAADTKQKISAGRANIRKVHGEINESLSEALENAKVVEQIGVLANRIGKQKLYKPVPAMDIVMIGLSAYSDTISSVAARSVKTSFLFCGITAIFGISASNSCILRRRPTISSLSGVLSKSWLEATTATPASCAASMISFT